MDGDTNCVADCLSQYYENDGPDDHHPDHDFMSANTKLDPDRKLIPIQRYTEMHTAATRQSHMIQSLGCPFKGVSQKCMEPLVYSWAEIYQVPLYMVGPRYIKCPCIWLG